jgi:hypothetical protein
LTPREGFTIYSKLTDWLKQLKAPHVRSLDHGRTSAAKRSAFWMNHPVLVYTLVIAFLSVILVFGLIGISVARESTTDLPHIWVPRLLAIASGFLIATILYRIIRRILR